MIEPETSGTLIDIDSIYRTRQFEGEAIEVLKYAKVVKYLSNIQTMDQHIL
jgi:hypothetical protein